jgi:hypothetical protein
MSRHDIVLPIWIDVSDKPIVLAHRIRDLNDCISVQTSATARPYDATETGAQSRDTCWERRQELDRATLTTYPKRTFGDLDVDRAGVSLANHQLS